MRELRQGGIAVLRRRGKRSASLASPSGGGDERSEEEGARYLDHGLLSALRAASPVGGKQDAGLKNDGTPHGKHCHGFPFL